MFFGVILGSGLGRFGPEFMRFPAIRQTGSQIKCMGMIETGASVLNKQQQSHRFLREGFWACLVDLQGQVLARFQANVKEVSYKK